MKSSTGGRIAKRIKVLLGPSSSIAMKTTEIHHRPRTYHFTTFYARILVLALIALISLSIMVSSQPVNIVYAEIFIQGNTSKIFYVRIPRNNPLILTLNKGDNATIRVDSISQLKPRKVLVTKGKCSYAVFDDHVFIEAESKCEILVYFEKATPKPPIYLLRISGQRKANPGSNITVQGEPEWKVWGILITLLATNAQAQIKSKYPASLLRITQHIINTSIGPILEYEETFWVAGKSFEAPAEALNIIYIPIYYRIQQAGNLVVAPNDIIYVNKPAMSNLTIKNVEIEKSVPGLDVLKIYFKHNPIIFLAKTQGKIELTYSNFIQIKIENQPEDLILEASAGNMKVKGRGEVSIRPSPGIPITLKVYTEAGDIAGEYEISSIAPELKIPIELYNARINVVDIEGHPLYNSTISLYRALKTLTAHLEDNNSVVFENLVKGEYIVTVNYMGEEVAREAIYLGKDSTFIIRARVRSIQIKAFNAKGDPVQNYTAMLYLNKEIIGMWHTNYDTLKTPPLPFNNYTLVIMINNYEVWKGKINPKESSSIMITLKLAPITIKVKNAFGAPLSRVSVLLRNNNTWSTLTDSSGRAIFNNIPFGNYTLTIKIGEVLAVEKVEINSSSTQFISVQVPVVAVIGGLPILVIHAQIIIAISAILIMVVLIRHIINRQGKIVIE